MILLVGIIVGFSFCKPFLYLDPQKGSDDVNCTLKSSPCKTLQHVIDMSLKNYHISLLSDLVVDKAYVIKNIIISFIGNGNKLTFTGDGSLNVNMTEQGLGFLFEKCDIIDSTTEKKTIITIPTAQLSSLSYCTIFLTKSLISVDSIENSAITIHESGFFDVREFNNCTITGENVNDKTNIFPNGATLRNHMEWFDFPLYYDTATPNLAVQDSVFHYSQQYTKNYAMYFSDGSNPSISATIDGFDKSKTKDSDDDSTTTLVLIDQKSRAEFSSFFASNCKVDNLITITEGTAQFTSSHFRSNEVTNSLFYAHGGNSEVTLTTCEVGPGNTGNTVYDLEDCLGMEDTITQYSDMTNFGYFFECSNNNSTVTHKTTTIRFSKETSTLSPYINGVICTGGCAVSGFSSCSAFYEEYENPDMKKKKKDDGKDDWKKWGIPVIAGGGVLLIVCVCCVLVVVAAVFFGLVVMAGLGGTGTLNLAMGGGGKGKKLYERVDGDDGDDIF